MPTSASPIGGPVATSRADEAEQLARFADLGYLTFSLDLDEAFCRGFDDDVARLWEERPDDLAVSPPGPGGPTSFADWDGPVREIGYRIPDLHSHSKHARELYLHPRIFRIVELIYGAPAIAFQSLYFEYGSQQGLHRDPMFVVTDPPSHLLASWVALEDITADSGPLAYVPGSQHLPWYEFEPGTVVCGQGVSPERRAEFRDWTHAQLRERGLEVMPFTARRGDVFVWHGGLVARRHADRERRRGPAAASSCTTAPPRTRPRARPVCACATATAGDGPRARPIA